MPTTTPLTALAYSLANKQIIRYLSPAMVTFLERVAAHAIKKSASTQSFFYTGVTAIEEIKSVLGKVPNYSPKSIERLGMDIWDILKREHRSFDLSQALSQILVQFYISRKSCTEVKVTLDDSDIVTFIHNCYANSCLHLARDASPLITYEKLESNKTLTSLCERSIENAIVDFYTDHREKSVISSVAEEDQQTRSTNKGVDDITTTQEVKEEAETRNESVAPRSLCTIPGKTKENEITSDVRCDNDNNIHRSIYETTGDNEESVIQHRPSTVVSESDRHTYGHSAPPTHASQVEHVRSLIEDRVQNEHDEGMATSIVTGSVRPSSHENGAGSGYHEVTHKNLYDDAVEKQQHPDTEQNDFSRFMEQYRSHNDEMEQAEVADQKIESMPDDALSSPPQLHKTDIDHAPVKDHDKDDTYGTTNVMNTFASSSSAPAFIENGSTKEGLRSFQQTLD